MKGSKLSTKYASIAANLRRHPERSRGIPLVSPLSYIRRNPLTSLRFARDDRAGCRRGLSPPRRHREIFPFCSPPSSQALANLFAQAKIGNEAIVELAPAGILLT